MKKRSVPHPNRHRRVKIKTYSHFIRHMIALVILNRPRGRSLGRLLFSKRMASRMVSGMSRQWRKQIIKTPAETIFGKVRRNSDPGLLDFLTDNEERFIGLVKKMKKISEWSLRPGAPRNPC
jgi:hypothetical protein